MRDSLLFFQNPYFQHLEFPLFFSFLKLFLTVISLLIILILSGYQRFFNQKTLLIFVLYFHFLICWNLIPCFLLSIFYLLTIGSYFLVFIYYFISRFYYEARRFLIANMYYFISIYGGIMKAFYQNLYLNQSNSSKYCSNIIIFKFLP